MLTSCLYAAFIKYTQWCTCAGFKFLWLYSNKAIKYSMQAVKKLIIRLCLTDYSPYQLYYA